MAMNEPPAASCPPSRPGAAARAIAGAGLAILLLAGGCSSSSDPSDDLDASFVADRTMPVDGDVHLGEGFTGGSNIGVLVRLTGIAEIKAALFTLEYDTRRAEFNSFAPGNALEMGGGAVNYSIIEGPPGRIEVEIERAAGTADVDFTSTLVRLNFRVTRRASSRVDFIPPPTELRVLLDGNDDEIAGLSWFGGSLDGS